MLAFFSTIHVLLCVFTLRLQSLMGYRPRQLYRGTARGCHSRRLGVKSFLFPKWWRVGSLARMAMWSSAGSWFGPSPADLRSAASPAPRARRYGRCRGQGSGKGDEASGMEDGVPCARTDPLPPTCGRRPLSPAGTSGPSRPAPAPAASPRPRRCAGEAIWPLPRPVSGPKRRGFKRGPAFADQVWEIGEIVDLLG